MGAKTEKGRHQTKLELQSQKWES